MPLPRVGQRDRAEEDLVGQRRRGRAARRATGRGRRATRARAAAPSARTRRRGPGARGGARRRASRRGSASSAAPLRRLRLRARRAAAGARGRSPRPRAASRARPSCHETAAPGSGSGSSPGSDRAGELLAARATQASRSRRYSVASRAPVAATTPPRRCAPEAGASDPRTAPIRFQSSSRRAASGGRAGALISVARDQAVFASTPRSASSWVG